MDTVNEKFVFTEEQEKFRRELDEAWTKLEHARDVFIKSLKGDGNLPAWSSGDGQNSKSVARASAAAIYEDFRFPVKRRRQQKAGGRYADADDNEKDRVVVSKDYGVIGASASTLVHAAAYNRAKEEFDEKLAPLRALKFTSPETIQMDRAVLLLKGLGYLSQQQACRKLVIVDHCPKTVTFFWSDVLSVSKVTVDRLTAALKDMPSTSEINKAIWQLSRFETDEPIAIVRPLKPHMRVIIGSTAPADKVRKKDDPDKAKRPKARRTELMRYVQKPTAMPILVLFEPGNTWPTITSPDPLDPNSTKAEIMASKKTTRALKSFVQPPFLKLKAFSAYRYVEDKREEFRRDKKWRESMARQNTLPYKPVIGSLSRGALSE
jgi:hypothetical protein